MKKTLLMLFFAVCTMRAASWRYYPAYDSHADKHGLTFYFTGSGQALDVTVTVYAVDGGREVQKTITWLSVGAGPNFLPIQIDEEHRYQLVRVVLRIDGREYQYPEPQHNRQYTFLP